MASQWATHFHSVAHKEQLVRIQKKTDWMYSSAKWVFLFSYIYCWSMIYTKKFKMYENNIHAMKKNSNNINGFSNSEYLFDKEQKDCKNRGKMVQLTW